MRTTVTLDDDLAVRLERLSQELGRSFKSVINEALRAGLDVMRMPEQRRSHEEFTASFDLGEPLFGDMLPSRTLAQIEEEDALGSLDVSR